MENNTLIEQLDLAFAALQFDIKIEDSFYIRPHLVLANDTIGLTDAALEKLMKQRADLGAYSNRLEVTARGLMSAYENVQASESRIRDADMAQELVELTRSQILESAASSMLTQANLRGRAALRLLE